MNRFLRRTLSLGLFSLMGMIALPVIARAEPEAVPGEGREVFIAGCTSCHSLDYIEMHARFGTRALWENEVAKMRNAFKAPVSDEDAKAIVDYLEKQYGPKVKATAR